jgi:D-alanyl-D-alanine carboxypeptidase
MRKSAQAFSRKHYFLAGGMVLLLLAGGVFLFLCGCRSTLTPLPPKETRTYQSVLEWSLQNGMPGAMLRVQTPKTNFIACVGWADRERRIPLRPDHAFRIGSLTKTFVSLVAAQMEAEGQLKADAVITNYLPASVTSHIANSDKTTVRQLLRHTSGIYNFEWNNSYILQRWFLDRCGNWPPERMLKYVYDQPAYFAPGQGGNYSDSNLLLVGMILDRLAGHHHSIEIRRRILDPLQLTNTYYELSEPPRGERVHGYENPFGFWEDTYQWTPVTGGSAGMVSTMSDLAVFLRAVVGTNSFLDEATRKVLKGEPDPKLDPSEAAGRFMVRYDFALLPLQTGSKAPWYYGHRGVSDGCLCLAFYEPKNDITIVYMGTSANLRVVNPLKRIGDFYDALEQSVFEMAVQSVKP